MIITPLAAESLGVRSSAVLVETEDVKVLIDPGVSLAPARFGLGPHPLEIRRMNEAWLKIKREAVRADVLVITHYHFDHFDPTEALVFRDKTVLLKHPEETINASQRGRARNLLRSIGTLPRRMETADGKEFAFGGTVIRFSGPAPHGPGMNVGWVVQVSVRAGGEAFLYTSDVQGAPRPEHLGFILSEGPGLVYLDGPPTYLMGQGFGPDDLRASLRNIGEVIGSARVHTLIIDHHLLRDAEWRNEIREVVQRAMAEGKKIVTAAEYLGAKEELLEANRKRLFEQYPDMPGEPLQRSRNFQLSKEKRK